MNPGEFGDAQLAAAAASAAAWRSSVLLVDAIVNHKAIFVGEAPGPPPASDDPRHALTGRSGRFLAKVAGASWKSWLRDVGRCNLLQRWPGRSGVGSAFDSSLGRACAAKLAAILELEGYRGALVLLGKRVASCFGSPGSVGFLECGLLRRYASAHCYSLAYVVLPHPSGLCREWNDPTTRQEAAKVVGRAFDGTLGERVRLCEPGFVTRTVIDLASGTKVSGREEATGRN